MNKLHGLEEDAQDDLGSMAAVAYPLLAVAVVAFCALLACVFQVVV